jgi:putative lipoic acid-binding regulatory protein
MTDTNDSKPSALTFPCDFVIKVFGLTTDIFVSQIATIVREDQPDLADSAIVSRPSKDGKYQALSITVHVTSQQELDAIYTSLSSNPLVLMAL